MSNVSLDDIGLREVTLERMPRLSQLRQALLGTPPAVCIERARYVTGYLKDLAAPDEAPEVRYASAVAHFLAHKAPLFFDGNLIAGTTCSKPFGAPVYPELTGLTIWPELDTISTRGQNPQQLSRQDADALNREIFPFWMDRTVQEYTRGKHGNLPCMKLFERVVFFVAGKAGCISHTVPWYQTALEEGLQAIIDRAAAKAAELTADEERTAEQLRQLDFYNAVQIALKGLIRYAENLSARAAELAEVETDPERKANLTAVAEVCRQVPAGPARTLREAVNALWLIQVGIHAEHINMAMSPGRLDQVLYPYYRADIDSGRLTVEAAAELIGCLWLKLNDNTNLVPETAEELWGGAGTVPAVTLGGVDTGGEDAVNDLTYVMLRVTELMKTRDPSVNARYHYEKNERRYLKRVAEVIASTRAVPALHNDVADIRTLVNQGTALEHARDYAVIGCVELASAGRSYDASSSILLNLVAVLELALYNGKRPITGDDPISIQTGPPEAFETHEDFWKAVEAQLRWVIGKAIELNELYGRTYQEMMPSPLLSACFQGPMEAGKDLISGGALYNSSGATHIGFADTVDSLSAIQQAVFVDRTCSMSELLAALRADFKGHERLHAYLVNRTPKYGTEDPIANENAQRLLRFLYDFYQSHTNYRGGKYRPGYWTVTNHAGQGKMSGALPNGRKARQVLASGITPVSQAAQDLAACLQAVGGLDGLCIPSGEALNLKFPSLESETELDAFCSAVETYFRCGGLHVQFNIMSYEMLLDAKAHPEKYPDLLVRVSGYSAYFKDLNDAMKDEIITRAAYDIRTGKAIPFPEEHRSMMPNS